MYPLQDYAKTTKNNFRVFFFREHCNGQRGEKVHNENNLINEDYSLEAKPKSL